MKVISLVLLTVMAVPLITKAQTAEELMKKIKEKLDKVNDYQ